MPPEFYKLPEPKSLIKDSESVEEEVNLKTILTNETSTTNTTSISETSNDSLEKSILEKIRTN